MRKYLQIQGHIAEMSLQDAKTYTKPVMVGFDGEVKMCKRDGDVFYHYDRYDDSIGEPFCDVEHAEAIRGCTSFDF